MYCNRVYITKTKYKYNMRLCYNHEHYNITRHNNKLTGVKFEQHWRNNISIFSKMTQSLKLKCPKDFRDDKMVDVMRQIVAKED